jgi:hypothetical protein
MVAVVAYMVFKPKNNSNWGTFGVRR